VGIAKFAWQPIRLATHTDKHDIKISSIRRYSTFISMLDVESYKKIVPWANSMEEVLSLLRQFYPKKKEQLGVVVLEFGLINE